MVIETCDDTYWTSGGECAAVISLLFALLSAVVLMVVIIASLSDMVM